MRPSKRDQRLYISTHNMCVWLRATQEIGVTVLLFLLLLREVSFGQTRISFQCFPLINDVTFNRERPTYS